MTDRPHSNLAVVTAAEPAPATARDWDLQAVIDWLVREGRLISDPARLVEALAEHLVATGAPLSRFTIGLQTIHPQWRTMGIQWRRGAKVVQGARPHGIEQTPDYIGSPIQELALSGRPVRYRLDRLTPQNHSVLHERRPAAPTTTPRP